MNGFGFIEYKDSMDARDVVPGKPLIPTLAVRRHHHLTTDRCLRVQAFGPRYS